MDINQEVLRKQIMVNQFCNQVGCTTEQATEILQKARWQIEVAFSLFFQGHSLVPGNQPNVHHYHNAQESGSSSSMCGSSASSTGMESGSNSASNTFGARVSYSCVPTNTPATPPTLPDTLAAFAQLKASSPDQRGGFDARIVNMQNS